MSHIQVFVRQRPCETYDEKIHISGTKIQNGCQIVTKKDDNSMEREILLDGLWEAQCTQKDVFTEVGKPSVDRALSGFNSTVICFGPTGSGKSYTVFGEHEEDINSQIVQQRGFDHPDNERVGLVPRMLQYLFQQSEARAQFEYAFHVSFVELYLDQPYDLLINAPKSRPNSTNRGSRPGSALNQARPGSAMNQTFSTLSRPGSATGARQPENDETRQKLTLRQTIHGSFYAENLTVKSIASAREGFNLLQQGYEQRATFATKVNERSSRSHAIFTVGIIQKSRATGVATGSLLTFVDLAGAENLQKSQSTGQRQIEQSSINRTLSTLGSVIAKIATNQQHIPFRESKLTKLLQDALGGTSYTTMVCNIHPLLSNDAETFLTLQFGNRCRNIATKPKVGVIDLSGINANERMKALVQEIEHLKNEHESIKQENEQLKKELESHGIEVENVNPQYEQLLKQEESEFKKSIKSMPQEQQEKAWQYKRLHDQQNGGDEKSRSIKFVSKTEKKDAQKDGKDGKRDESGENQVKDSECNRANIMQLKQKVARMSKEIYNLQLKTRDSDVALRLKTRELSNQTSELRDRIQIITFNHLKEVQEIKELHSQEIKNVASAQCQLVQNQQKLLTTFTTMVPNITLKKNESENVADRVFSDQKDKEISMKKQINELLLERDQLRQKISLMKDDIKGEVYTEFDNHKQKEIKDITERHQKQLEHVKAEFAEERKQFQQKQLKQEEFIEKLQTTIVYLYHEYKNLATLIQEAKEGKIDSHLINEQQIIQDYMNYDFSTKKQRIKVKAALQIQQERDLQVIPSQIMEIINEVQMAEAATLQNKKQTIFTSRPQSMKVNKVANDFIQPKMVTRGFNVKAKPPIIMLDTNLHISPRPHTAEVRDLTTSMKMSMNMSSGRKSVTQSQVGSMGGTKELINKQYQQWGY